MINNRSFTPKDTGMKAFTLVFAIIARTLRLRFLTTTPGKFTMSMGTDDRYYDAGYYGDWYYNRGNNQPTFYNELRPTEGGLTATVRTCLDTQRAGFPSLRHEWLLGDDRPRQHVGFNTPGMAPFHYGDGTGTTIMAARPGYEAPAWVTWRSGGGYYGWALGQG